ncbi:MAG TPA: BT_3928 family protein [Chitinophagaceae bacterium]|nr:BT_3928 family protein [Chitinophagaceae bacterium]
MPGNKMKISLTMSRIIVGVLFVFSGLIKANDPYGLSYKMQEFFEAWGWNFLNDYTLWFSILMIAFEIIAGVSVLLGWAMRLFSWLLLVLIIFFSFLTAYALFSGKIKTCGCFGDCIPLTPNQSFTKDLILLGFILLIFVYRDKIKPFFNLRLSLGFLIFTAGLSFGFQWYVLQYLPVKDCLPYKRGNNIIDEMKVPANAVMPIIETQFVYEKGGKRFTFTSTFPEDLDTYRFVSRKDKIIKEGKNYEPPIKDFKLHTLSNVDTTEDILNHSGEYYFLFIKDFEGIHLNDKWLTHFSRIVQKLKDQQIPLYVITAQGDIANAFFNTGKNHFNITILTCDGTEIKTAARTKPCLFKMRGAVVENKWGKASLGSLF